MVDDQDYEKMGTYDVVLKYKKEEATVKVSVVDTTKPVFKEFEEEIETYKEVIPDYSKMFTTEDIDTDIQIVVDEEKIDYTKEGSYETTVTATDSSGNNSVEEITVIVKKPTLEIKEKEISLSVGDTKTIEVTIHGKDNKATYKSSDESIVSIDENGKATAKKEGTATVAIKANDTEETCKITVKKASSTNNSVSSSSKNTSTSTSLGNSSGIPAGKSITVSLPKKASIPSSIAKGSLNDNEYQVVCEILDILHNSNSDNAEVSTVLLNGMTSLDKVLALFKEVIGVDLQYRQIYKYQSGYKIYVNAVDMRATVAEYNKKIDYYSMAYSQAGVYSGINERDAVIRLNNWICSYMTYVITNNNDSHSGFYSGKGQCYHYAHMLKYLCDYAGITCEIIDGYAVGTLGGGYHEWNRVTISGKQYYVDVTWNDTTNNQYLLSPTLWSSHTIQ